MPPETAPGQLFDIASSRSRKILEGKDCKFKRREPDPNNFTSKTVISLGWHHVVVGKGPRSFRINVFLNGTLDVIFYDPAFTDRHQERIVTLLTLSNRKKAGLCLFTFKYSFVGV